MDNKKVILATAKAAGSCNEYCCDEDLVSEVKILETMKDVVENLVYDISHDYQAFEVLIKNERFLDMLDEHGFVNSKKVKSQSEKAKLLSQFYLVQLKRYSNARKVSLDELSDWELEELAEGNASLMQLVSNESLKKIDSKAYKSLENKKIRLKEKEDKKKQRAKARAEKKKLKEIEAAKSLLESEGVEI